MPSLGIYISQNDKEMTRDVIKAIRAKPLTEEQTGLRTDRNTMEHIVEEDEEETFFDPKSANVGTMHHISDIQLK